MFDIVTADEDDASFPVDRQGFDYCYPRWCVAAAEPVEHVSSGRNDNEKICFHRRDGPELGPARRHHHFVERCVILRRRAPTAAHCR
jgi:hypothetical protein